MTEKLDSNRFAPTAAEIQRMRRVAGGLENTEFIMNNTFWVGVYPGMTDEMIDYMAQIITEAVNQK